MRIPILPAVLMILLSALIDFYIFNDIRRYCKSSLRKGAKVAYGIFTLLCWLLLIVFIVWPKKNPDEPILVPMWLLFTYLSVYISKAVYCLVSLLAKLTSRTAKVRAKCCTWVGLPLSLLVFIFMWSGIIKTRYDIEVNNAEIVSDRLPASMDGLRVLQVSDLHLGTWGNDTTFVSELVDSINAQKADVVVFTGDFVNRTSAEMVPFVPVLSRVKAPMGVYAVLGNHDYGGYVEWNNDEDYHYNLERLFKAVDDSGWTLLKNQSVMIRNTTDSIAMIGVENWGEPPFNQLGDLVKAYGDPVSTTNLNDSVFKILLTHNPNHWDEVVTKISNVDLSMAGHTHAMQFEVNFFGHKWSPSVWKYPRWGGLYESVSSSGTPMYLYVNVGAGEVGFPARLGAAKPELNIITLKSAKR